jgi:hypothetical protein
VLIWGRYSDFAVNQIRGYQRKRGTKLAKNRKKLQKITKIGKKLQEIITF